MTDESIAREKIEAGINQIEELYKQRKDLYNQISYVEKQIQDVDEIVLENTKIFREKYTDDVFKYVSDNNMKLYLDNVVEHFKNVMPERATNNILYHLIYTHNKIEQINTHGVYFYKIVDNTRWR